jgi:hypothetical protein
VPGANVVDVEQLVAGSVAVQRTALVDVEKVTVPVAVFGRPVSARRAVEPLLTALEDTPLTVMVNDVAT